MSGRGIAIFVGAFLTILLLVGLVMPRLVGPPRNTGTSSIFETMTTSDLCARLRSPSPDTRENGLIAMMGYHGTLPGELADAMASAIAAGTIGELQREDELIRWQLGKNRQATSDALARLLDQHQRLGSVTLCDGGSVTLDAAALARLQAYFQIASNGS